MEEKESESGAKIEEYLEEKESESGDNYDSEDEDVDLEWYYRYINQVEASEALMRKCLLDG